ncbi:MAG: tRNA lysidine(34) synthetase TilS, partial [Gammaproteobacteria bacterium]|nr:tRNA lysidine(34) synthetase TilS [Gammaproteobacteria bacterium]
MLHTTILNNLLNMPKTRHYWIAFSGGMDSHSLLCAMAELRNELPGARISAIHVNHRLQPDADRWARHASAMCDALGMTCNILIADANAAPGESPEAAARYARYGAMREIVGTDEILLTAHHLDDQAETLLLQMIRGAGARGLAAMPRVARFGTGWLGRPLLGTSRRILREYATSRGLSWIEDNSNDDKRFDRNYLRHEILPRLQARWPAVNRTLGRVAAHQADTARQLEQLAESDLEQLHGGADNDHPRAPTGNTLSCDRLRRLPEHRLRNALHAWFRRLDLPVPNAVHIKRILMDVIDAAPDREPLVRWKGAEVRRYRDMLHAGPPLSHHDSTQVIDWSLDEPLSLPHGRLMAKRIFGAGLRAAACPGDRVEVRFRQGGERCRITKGGYTHFPVRHRENQNVSGESLGRFSQHAVEKKLKKLFQEQGIAPWERDRI